jgi:hypothetical protein
MQPLFASEPLCLTAFSIAFAAWAIPEIGILFMRCARGAFICDQHSLATLIALVWAGLAIGVWVAFEQPWDSDCVGTRNGLVQASC